MVNGSQGKSIDGLPIVGSYCGDRTGDTRYVTSDGRHWETLHSGVPTSIPTGVVISTIKQETNFK